MTIPEGKPCEIHSLSDSVRTAMRKTKTTFERMPSSLWRSELFLKNCFRYATSWTFLQNVSKSPLKQKAWEEQS